MAFLPRVMAALRAGDVDLVLGYFPELTSADEPELSHDSSTNALIRRYRALR